MSDETTDASNEKGKEDNSDTKEPTEPNKVDESISPLDRAEEINKEKAANLILEKENLDRREKLLAEEKVGGRAKAGTPQTPEEIEKEKANERVLAVGRAGGAQWAKPKE